jgi:hypothetical protein
MPNKMILNFFAAEEIADSSQVCEFQVELNKTGNFRFCLCCVDTSFIPFKVEEDR